ncbi:hypothetical protein PCANC_18527 [Puccinia coronata f. sp. avenae]|uniref:Uncharacterized protein n=1 Tax=Puccinia coronata f. sp. avenae TaxID=200324 RepID=A0A2N5SB39_9BASI|nr:hypothetical protein PCANC_18527 [Puccinia coronata f. sp. avenae]
MSPGCCYSHPQAIAEPVWGDGRPPQPVHPAKGSVALMHRPIGITFSTKQRLLSYFKGILIQLWCPSDKLKQSVPQMLLPHFAPPNKISAPILKPIDFQVYPLISQATLEQLERSRQRCFIAKNQILKRSAEIRSKLNQHVHEQHVHVSPCPGSAERISLSPDPITKSSPLPGSPPCPSSDRLESEVLHPPARGYTGGASSVSRELSLNPELQPTFQHREDSPESSSSAETALWDRPRKNPPKRPRSGRDSCSPTPIKRANSRVSQSPLSDHSYHIDTVGDCSSSVLDDNPSGYQITDEDDKTPTPSSGHASSLLNSFPDALPDLDYLFAPLDQKNHIPLPAHRGRSNRSHKGTIVSTTITKDEQSCLVPQSAHTITQRARVSPKLEIHENASPLLDSCGSPRIPYSWENTPATLSPFDQPAESLADDNPTSSPARTRPTNKPIRDSTTSKDAPPPGDPSKLFIKKPVKLPLSKLHSVVDKKPPPKKQPFIASSALPVPNTKTPKRVKTLPAVNPPNQSSYPTESCKALTHNLQARRRSSDFDKENCHVDNRVAPPVVEPAVPVAPPSVAPPVRVGQIDFQNLPDLEEGLRVAAEGYIVSWPARLVVMAMNRIILYRLNVLRWGPNSYKPVSIADLRGVLGAMHYHRINELINACRNSNHPCNTLAEALQYKPIKATVFLRNQGLETTIELKRDFTPLGLTYFPIIKTLRAFWCDNTRKATWGEFRECFSRRPNSGLHTAILPKAETLQIYAQSAEEDKIFSTSSYISLSCATGGHLNSPSTNPLPSKSLNKFQGLIH